MQAVESLFLDANKSIDEHQIAKAKDLLHEIVALEPSFGRAHNHLAWIYETKIGDLQKAQMHYELAIKFCKKTYAIVYVNYVYLLIDINQYDKALEMVEEGLTVVGVHKATMLCQKGKIYENKNDFRKSVNCYIEAKKQPHNKDFEEFLTNEMARITNKMSFTERFFLKIRGKVK